jgi:hypothetical protein
MNYFYDLPDEIQQYIYKKMYDEIIKDIVNHPLIFIYEHLDLECDFCDPPYESEDNIHCVFCLYTNCQNCRHFGCGCDGRRLNSHILTDLP